MAVEWGAWSGVDRQIRLGIEVDWSGPVAHGWGTVKATVSYWVDVRNGSFSDSQTLNFSGWIDGSFTKVNYQSGGAGSAAKWETKSITYIYGNCEYGSSPGTRTFTVKMTGAGGGNINPTQSVTKNIPSRPYGAPLVPTNVNTSRISDTSLKTTWSNRENCGEPWDRVRVQYDVAANDLWNGDVATPSGGSTSYTYSWAEANTAYRFRVRSENNISDSSWVEGDLIYTTPATPTEATRAGANGANQTISWVNNTSPWMDHRVLVERSSNGGAYTQVFEAARDSTGWVDTFPASNPATKFKYRIRVRTNGGVQGTLYSDYSEETTETTGVSTPPSAPTNLAPSANTIINPTFGRSFTWQHNSTDTTAQTGFQFQWRVVGAGSWTVLTKQVTATPSWTAIGGTFPDNSSIEWQVRTWGLATTGGADGTGASLWSATATLKTVGDPNALREQKRVLRMNLESGMPETATVGVLPPIGSLLMFGGAVAPSGWLLCRGQSLLRADYLDLFGVIGIAFGAVDVDHFTLPDLQDRIAVGVSGSKALGTNGGSATAAIGTPHLPPHAHDAGAMSAVSNGAHVHVLDLGSAGSGNYPNRGIGPVAISRNDGVNSGGAHTHTLTGSTADTGGGTALPIQNPYTAINYIIKW